MSTGIFTVPALYICDISGEPTARFNMITPNRPTHDFPQITIISELGFFLNGERVPGDFGRLAMKVLFEPGT